MVGGAPMVLMALAILVGLAALAWLGWSTVLAFVGGDIPLTPFHLSGGNSLRGLSWLFVGDPIALGVITAAVSVVFMSRSLEHAAARTAELPGAAVDARMPSLSVLKFALSSSMAGSVRVMVVAAFSVVLAVSGMCWLLWATVIAFVGGRIPLLPWHLAGINVTRGFLWLVILDPVAFVLMIIGYSLAVTATVAGPMRAALGTAAAQGTEVRTARRFVRLATLLSIALALAAGLVWRFTK